ncbi:hypothetical protein [Moraxella lacunata]|uniref:hypothetical protein n=1 Tax=Moraxella lacunata TaxID=477 RepID=UPI003EE3E459
MLSAMVSLPLPVFSSPPKERLFCFKLSRLTRPKLPVMTALGLMVTSKFCVLNSKPLVTRMVSDDVNPQKNHFHGDVL